MPTYICGDFNFNLFSLSDPNSNATRLLETFATFGYIQTITKASRLSNFNGTAIDHIFINDLSTFKEAGVFIDSPSDHFATYLEIKMEKPKPKKNSFKLSRDFSPNNLNRFKQSLLNMTWVNILNTECTNTATNNFLEVFMDLYNIFFPISRIKINKNYHRINNFMTKGLLVSRSKNISLAHKAQRFPTDLNKLTSKTYRNKYNSLIRISKKIHYNSRIRKAGRDSRAIWSVLKEAINIPSKDSTVGPILINGTVVNNDILKADFFNTFFSNVGVKTSSFIPTTDVSFQQFLPPPCRNSMFLNPISETTYVNFVLSLKPKTSTDIRGISTKFLQSVIYEIKSPLTHIFNTSIQNGIFPEALKISKAIPIFKSGDKTLVDNYRLVSLVDSFSKPMEKIMCSRLLDFLESNNFFMSSQFGFRKTLSTKHCLLAIINYITRNINNNKITLGVFIDVMKAFDSVNHQILFKKLHNAGVRGVVLDWFVNYLKGRKQKVFLNGIYSENFCEIILGVLQGSILGVILFLIMMNDIKNVSPSLFNAIFADDNSSLLEDISIEALIEKANIELDKLVKWYSSNRFAIHPAKSKCMLFAAPNKINLPQINNTPHFPVFFNMNNFGESDNNKITLIKLVPNDEEQAIKVLGIFLDNKLNFKVHISTVHAKLSKSIYSLKQMRHLLDGNHLKLLFSSYVKSHLDYADIFYCLCSKATLRPLELLYKKAIRILSGAGYRDHTLPLFKDNNILPITENSHLNILKLMYRCDHRSLPNSITDFWRRNRENFYQETININYLENHPLFFFPKLYNELDQDLKELLDGKEFGKKVKSLLLDSLV